MGKQVEIVDEIDLHDNRGHLKKEGWSRFPLWRYQKSRVKYHRWFQTLKEWDYYSIISREGQFGLCFTLADLGKVVSLGSIAFLDFTTGHCSQVDSIRFPFFSRAGKIGFSEQSFDDCIGWHDSKLQLCFDWTGDDKGILSFACPTISNGKGESGLIGRIVVKRTPQSDESLNIATSWGKASPTSFYYNRKVNCISIITEESGFHIGKQRFTLNGKLDYAALDWGRGIWTWRNRWFWSSLSATLPDGKSFGWNLGYGFSDRSSASENVVIYDGKIHKLDQVEFVFDAKDYEQPWKITSNENRIEMDFVPIKNRHMSLNLGLIKSVQNQVFGRFTGFVILDDGTKLEITNVLGFAEDVLNWW